MVIAILAPAKLESKSIWMFYGFTLAYTRTQHFLIIGSGLAELTIADRA